MSRARHVRDQASSPFTVLLEEVLAAIPFMRAVAIFDAEGETVDYAGELDPYELRVAAATMQLVVAELRGCATLASTREVRIRARRAGYILRDYGEGYGLLCVVRALGTLVASGRVLDEIGVRIVREAGLPELAPACWHRVEVELDALGKPRRLRRAPRIDAPLDVPPWIGLELLGKLVLDSPRERAYRVRLQTGAEVTLLGESRALWFVDEQLELRDPRRLYGGTLADVFEGGR